MPADTVDTQAIADGAITPNKRSGGFKVGNFSAGASNGNFSVTGVGFKPKMVEFEWVSSSSNGLIGSGGMDEDGNQWARSTYVQGNAQNTEAATNRCFITTGSTGINRAAEFVSMDTDGFTINFLQSVSNTDIGYKAYA